MENYDSQCKFCNIINGTARAQKIYEDLFVMCIKNIYPASTHHYLIMPKKHIRNAKELKADEEELYDKLVSIVDVIMSQQCLDPAATRVGFHWPPFNTVHHLHLHVISPISNMSLVGKLMFKLNTYWFTDYVKSRFKRLNSEETGTPHPDADLISSSDNFSSK